MGFYNTIHFTNKAGEDTYIQSKNGDPCARSYSIDDLIHLDDGIYFGHEGSFVVFQGRLVAAFDVDEQHLYDKWDRPLEYPDLHAVNPIAQMIKALKEQLSIENETKDTGVTT